jgi:hypothetical protein
MMASNGFILHHAAAVTLAPPSALGTGMSGAGLVEKTTAVCGNNGCVTVQVKRLDKHQLRKPPPMVPARPPS